jgi:ferric-dicitrate binding protein FerR (iron transport regulator)
MWKSAGRAPSLRVFTLTFALQVRKKHGITTVRVRETSVRLIKTSVRVQYTYYQDTHTLQNRQRVTYIRCRIDTINSPDDGHVDARNMLRTEINIHDKRIVCQVGYLQGNLQA